jgi:FkbM family methyltransferase
MKLAYWVKACVLWDMSRIKESLRKVYEALPFKQPLFTVLRKAVQVPSSIHQHLHFKGVIHVPISPTEGFRIMHHGHVIENELFWKGIKGWEQVSLELWMRLCRLSSVICDIGANTGVYALTAKAVNLSAKVVAVEPVERVFRKLEANVLLNNWNIRTVNAAVSDHTGTAVLYDLPQLDHVLSVSLEADWNNKSSALRPVEVPCITVTDLLDEIGASKVDLLKIDVETHEPAVLRGFHELIQRDRPSMLIEILNEDVARQIAALLEGLDYQYYNIDDVTWPPPRVQALSTSGHFNFLLCQPAVAVAIGI